jgi:hypothetical protein
VRRIREHVQPRREVVKRPLRRHGGGGEDAVLLHRGVALQVEFERQILKPDFHLIGFSLRV